MNKTKKLKAFTLAEVLLTLGIIGCVAAMTFPSLKMGIDSKANIITLKKFYSEFSNATNILMSEYSEPLYWGLKDNNAAAADWVMARYNERLNIQRICGASDSTCFYFPIKSYRNGSNAITAAQYRSWSLRGFVLTNGVTGFVDVNNGNFSMFFDVNGFKGPNTLGVDIFAWAVNADGAIVRYSDPSLGGSGNDNPEYNYAFDIMEHGWVKTY